MVTVDPRESVVRINGIPLEVVKGTGTVVTTSLIVKCPFESVETTARVVSDSSTEEREVATED